MIFFICQFHFSFCFLPLFLYILVHEILPCEELYSYHIASPLSEAIIMFYLRGISHLFSREHFAFFRRIDVFLFFG